MSNRSKTEKDKDKDMAEWQLALDLQEKRLMEGMQDICNGMSENIKKFLRSELEDI